LPLPPGNAFCSFSERSGELRASLQGITTLARLYLNKHADQPKAFSLSETVQRVLLRFQAKP
jgi:hypothetical protein